MNVLKFTLSGATAFFKKPDVNTYVYFSYGNIHKMTILVIFGAIFGYGGYNKSSFKYTYNSSKKEKRKYEEPEFYRRLKNIKISIAPNNKQAAFNKKIQVFNNSVGYASGEDGGNLIVKEQWLENPSWDIYVLLDCSESEKIAEYIVSGKCIFYPYFGKNDHPADISNIEMIKGAESVKNVQKIDCLFTSENVSLDIDYEADEDEFESGFKYEEYLPVGLDSMGLYVLKKFAFTNMIVSGFYNDVFKVKEKNITFY